MSTDSIFENQNSGGTPPNNAGTSNTGNVDPNVELTNLLNNIKNERGEPKYKDVKEAIIGLQNAQNYIPTLKQTLAERETEITKLREQAGRAAELEETVRKLTEQPNTNGTPPKVLTEQDIAELVNRSLDTTLTAREQVSVMKRNTDSVVKALTDSFGADAEVKFNTKAAELGMSVAEFNTLAAKSPRLVLNALGIDATRITQSTGAPLAGTVNTQSITPRSDTFVGRNKVPALIGATTQDLMQESKNARKMVDELHASGLSVHDLSDPKVYMKHFG